MTKTRQKLEQHQADLTKKREAAASRMRSFNEIKEGLGPDERIERETELDMDLCRLDEQLEDVQHHLDVS